MRFDDTNPEKEEQEYVDGILDAVQWLGYGWRANGADHLYYASNYFDFMYRAAEALIEAGHAYVDEQSADEMRANRGDFNTPGTAARSATARPSRTWRVFARCAPAGIPTARWCCAPRSTCRARTSTCATRRSTASSTPSTTTPATRWCIYPMYTYAHPIEDALENITHSICTLEFEDQRPFYDWLLDTLCMLGLLAQPRPHQYEFARLNVTYVITSKRKLKPARRRETRRRLGRPAHADARRLAPARLHARVDPPDVRARRHQQGRRLDRLREPGHRAARRPRRQGARARWPCSSRCG